MGEKTHLPGIFALPCNKTVTNLSFITVTQSASVYSLRAMVHCEHPFFFRPNLLGNQNHNAPGGPPNVKYF
ncbi:hypothetical protein NB724_003365 [Pantoea ananatis]|nr:hypothetical protein [Pantoea ananatis]MCW0336225.1 hypothetical protein [Pantoea ananatis]MCW0384347.1 hypothetical protein [Pantoea ananatis]MCW0408991.1 hypothetical protein [Pantoea ananatis]MCW0429216.1 hypothetical protein [Pantoea ananatis]